MPFKAHRSTGHTHTHTQTHAYVPGLSNQTSFILHMQSHSLPSLPGTQKSSGLIGYCIYVCSTMYDSNINMQSYSHAIHTHIQCTHGCVITVEYTLLRWGLVCLLEVKTASREAWHVTLLHWHNGRHQGLSYGFLSIPAGAGGEDVIHSEDTRTSMYRNVS